MAQTSPRLARVPRKACSLSASFCLGGGFARVSRRSFFACGVETDVVLVKKFEAACWSELAVCFCNRLHGGLGTLGVGCPTKAQKALLESVERSAVQVLKYDVKMVWQGIDILIDSDKKLLSYTGEEIPKAEPLSCFRVAAALPPEGHGGCIKVEDFW